MSDQLHRPVLLDEVCEFLRPGPGGCCLDGTLGGGGYAERILALSQPDGKLIGLDRDPQALAAARPRLETFGNRVTLVHANFADAAEVLAELGVDSVHGIVLDLGLSSIQVDAPDRGFSFRAADSPLDMRADPTSGETAAKWLAHVPERELADTLWQLADERRSRRIARAICQARRREPIRTAGQLASIVERAAGGRRGRIHPATKSFMAIRMRTNREIPNLEALLAAAPDLLAPGGRIVIVSFHSVEDRIVKHAFRDRARQGVWRVLTRRPVTPTDAERRANARSRSAKLRAAERTD